MRTLMKWLVSGLVMLAVSLALLEGASWIYLRFLYTGKNALAMDPREAFLHLYRPSELMCVEIKPDYRQRYVNYEFNTEIVTNAQGWRDRPYDGRGVDVGFMGDSFTFGHGVEAAERWTDLGAQKAGIERAWTFSYASGWSPPMYELYLRAHPQFMPKKALVIGLFAWNDLAEDVSELGMVHDAQGRLQRLDCRDRQPNADGFLMNPKEAERARVKALVIKSNLGRLALIAYRNWQDKRDAESLAAAGPVTAAPVPFETGVVDDNAAKGLASVAALAEMTRARGVPLVVFVVPRRDWLDRSTCRYGEAACAALVDRRAPQALLAEHAARHGYHLIDPTPELRARTLAGEKLYFDLDEHWTPAGHAVAAEVLARELPKVIGR